MAFTHKITGWDDHTHDTVVEARACMDQMYQMEAEEAAHRGAADAEQAYERWLEDGGSHRDIIAWENERDLAGWNYPY